MDKPDSTQPQQTGGLKLMTVFIAVLALHVLVIGGFTVYHLMGSGGDADLTQDGAHKLKADGTAVADATTPDSAASDKNADAATTSPDTTNPPSPASTTTATAPDANPAAATTTAATAISTAATTEQPANAQTAATAPASPAPNGAPAPVSSAPPSPIVLSSDDMSQTSTIPPGLAPPPDAPAVAPATESAPAQEGASAQASPPVIAISSSASSGPVHMPANSPAPAASPELAATPEHTSASTREEHREALAREARHEIYTVKITDSYKKIAHEHHITVAQLKAANHITDNVLHEGQKLIIPESKTSLVKGEASHDSEAGESVSLTTSGTTHHHIYTVAKGDTLRKIAKKFDVTASAIEEANDLPSNKIAVGEKLRIPSHEAHSTASAASVGEPSTASWSAPEASVVPAPAPAPAPTYAPAPVTAPSAMAPSQVETQPAPVVQPAPAPAPEPQPSTESNPALANLTF